MEKIIKFYRTRLNYSQKEVAQYLGVSAQRYFVIESTDNVPLKYLDKLCTLFKVRRKILFKLLATKNKYLAPEEITYYRNQKGLTKQELAAELNTYHTYVYNWENGKFTPGTDNAEALMNFLQIPEYVIYPDIVEYDAEHIILELEEYFLIIGKQPFKYTERINDYCKEIKYAYLFSDCLYEMEAQNGSRSLFPQQLQSDPDVLMFEFETAILIITNYLLKEDQMNEIKLNAHKEVIFAVDDKMLFMIFSLKEKMGNYFFMDAIKNELSNLFTSVTCHNDEKKIVCSNTEYLCIIDFEKINNDIILINEVKISFLN